MIQFFIFVLLFHSPKNAIYLSFTHMKYFLDIYKSKDEEIYLLQTSAQLPVIFQISTSIFVIKSYAYRILKGGGGK